MKSWERSSAVVLLLKGAGVVAVVGTILSSLENARVGAAEILVSIIGAAVLWGMAHGLELLEDLRDRLAPAPPVAETRPPPKP